MAAARKKSTATPSHTPAQGRPPRLPETLVERARLYTRLDKACSAPLTQLIAPAGTGKTMLLSAWANRRTEAGATLTWLAAHEHQDLTARLCGAVGRRTGQVLKILADAAARDVQPDVVIVDDAHLLGRDQLLLLADILATTPDAVRLVLASRRDLPLPVLDLALTDRAITLRINDLRFTGDEAVALVRAHAERVTKNDVTQLVERTAGWAAALVLAARSMASDNEPGVLSPALVTTDQPVLDHLLGDAFDLLTEPARQVLLSTFSEPVTSASRAATLSGNPNAGDLLADLTSRGLLVTAYNTSGGVTYKYHPLLVELLRRRVFSSPADAETVRLAHLRSAGHAESQGQHADAVTSAIHARDNDLIGRLVVEYGPDVINHGRASVVGDAFDALPNEFIATHPGLLGLQALHRRSIGDVSGAVLMTARADRIASDRGLDRGPDEAQPLQADLLMLRLWQSRYGWQDASAAISDARAFLGCDHTEAASHRHRSGLALSPARLSWLLIELAAAEIWTGDLTAAALHTDEALVSAGASGHEQLVRNSLAHRAVIEVGRGYPRSAAATAQELLDVGDPESIDEHCAVRAHVVLALAAYSRLDVDTARKWQEEVEASEAATTDSVVSALRALLRAALLIEEGELDLARLTLAANPTAAGPLPTFLGRDLCLVRYHCATLVGDTEAANAQVEALRGLGLVAEADLLGAKLAARGMEPAAAARLLADAVAAAGAAHPTVVAWAEALRVARLLAAGETADARDGFLSLIGRITPQQQIRALTPAADEPAFADLVEDVAQDPDAPSYVGVVAEALAGHRARWLAVRRTLPIRPTQHAAVRRPEHSSTESPAPAAAPPRQLSIPAQPGREGVLGGIPIRLTARESDVLGQLALGSSYTEIAQELYITENTVKTHLASLYRKLGVDKRSAALRVARDVGLLV